MAKQNFVGAFLYVRINVYTSDVIILKASVSSVAPYRHKNQGCISPVSFYLGILVVAEAVIFQFHVTLLPSAFLSLDIQPTTHAGVGYFRSLQA